MEPRLYIRRQRW